MDNLSSSISPRIISGFAITGRDFLDYVRCAAIVFPTEQSNDFFAGPITSDLVQQLQLIKKNFDKIWLVKNTEILAHLQDLKDGKLDTPIESIMSWPGKGNPFFKQYNGFDFPNLDAQNDTFAPFFDADINGNYDPTKGDFPLPTQVKKEDIPERLLWSVSNDAGGPHTESFCPLLGIELQKTIWTNSKIPQNKWNGAVFGSYRIINRTKNNYDSVYISMLNDIDFGCDSQHKIIVDSLKNTFVDYLNYNKNEKCISAGTDIKAAQTSLLAFTMLNRKLLSVEVKAPGDVRSTLGTRFGTLARGEAKNFDFVYSYYQDSTKTFTQLLDDLNTEIPIIQNTYNGNNVVASQDIQNIDFQCVIYPNPAHETLNLAWNTAQQNTLKRVALLNIYGQIVATTPIENSQSLWQYDIQQLPKGTYIVRLETTEGIVNRKVEILR